MRRPRPSLLSLALATLAVLIGCAPADHASTRTSTSASSSVAGARTAASPCGWRTTPPARYDHIVWVVLENHSFEDVIGAKGSSTARRSPYVNGLAARCGLATRSVAVTHPSLPNYLALASGRTGTGAVTSSCRPDGCPQRQATVFGQLSARGRTWRVYAEGMPGACRHTDSGRYVVRHNPPTYFPALAADCATSDVALGSPSGGRLGSDLARRRLPALSVIVPDQCHNTHNCPVATGDRWLAQVLPRVLASRNYRAGRSAVILTWDEGKGGRRGENCRRTRDRSCHVVTVVIGPSTRPGTRSAIPIDHYALLKTTEELLGLPLLGHAGDPSTPSLRGPFHL